MILLVFLFLSLFNSGSMKSCYKNWITKVLVHKQQIANPPTQLAPLTQGVKKPVRAGQVVAQHSQNLNQHSYYSYSDVVNYLKLATCIRAITYNKLYP